MGDQVAGIGIEVTAFILTPAEMEEKAMLLLQQRLESHRHLMTSFIRTKADPHLLPPGEAHERH